MAVVVLSCLDLDSQAGQNMSLDERKNVLTEWLLMQQRMIVAVIVE